MKEKTNITLYGVTVSPYVRKVWVALQEKGLAFDHVETLPVSLLKATGQSVGTQFEKTSPLGKIPAIAIGEDWLSDSAVIAKYLDNIATDGPALYPIAPMDRAKAMWFEMYSDTVLTNVVYHKIFLEVCIKPSVLQQETDRETVTVATEQALPPLLCFLENQLNDSGWFAGVEMSMADVAIVTQLLSLEMAGVPLLPVRYPKLCSLLQRARQKDSFQSFLSGRR